MCSVNESALRQAERRVVDLDRGPATAAPSSAVERLRVGVDVQVPARARVHDRVVVGLRRVPVRDQQTLLVRVVVDLVRAGCSGSRSSTGRSSGTCRTRRRCGGRRCSSCRTALVDAGTDDAEAASGPAVGAGLGAVGEHRGAVGGDRDVVDEDAVRDVGVVARGRRVGRVAEPQADRLAGVRRQVERRRRRTSPGVPSMPLPSAGVGDRARDAPSRSRRRRSSLDVGVVAVRTAVLDVLAGLEASASPGPAGRSTVRVMRVVEVVAVAAAPLLGARRPARRAR